MLFLECQIQAGKETFCAGIGTVVNPLLGIVTIKEIDFGIEAGVFGPCPYVLGSDIDPELTDMYLAEYIARDGVA